MHVILIPGFWLDASSWREVTPALDAAGHRAHPVTRAGDSPAEQIGGVLTLVDALDGPLGLVAHSAAGLVASGLLDARPERFAHAVYIDSFPMAARAESASEYPVVDGAVPLPDWAAFEAAELADLDEGLEARIRAASHAEPLGFVTGPLELHDERRHAVPSTIITTSYPASAYDGYLEQKAPLAAEILALESLSWVELPTGHWPQFTKPHELGEAIVAALSAAAS